MTDVEAGIGNTDVNVQTADEISSPSKYNKLFNNSNVAISQTSLSILTWHVQFNSGSLRLSCP
jgi:hypothetical protein